MICLHENDMALSSHQKKVTEKKSIHRHVEIVEKSQFGYEVYSLVSQNQLDL